MSNTPVQGESGNQSQSGYGGSSAALCQGYNMVSGNSLNTAVEGVTDKEGSSTTATVEIAVSMEQLAKKLSFEQSLSLGFANIIGADEKYKFMSELQITTLSLCVVVHIKKLYGKEFLKDASFKAGISIPSKDKDVDIFAGTYGDSYVESISTGGEFIGVIHFTCQSQEERSKLKASVDASGLLGSLGLASKQQTALDDISSKTTASISFSQYTSGLRNPPPSSPQTLLKDAGDFMTTELDSPVVIARELKGYETLPQNNGVFKKLAQNRRLITGAGAGGSISTVTKLCRITDIINQMRAVASIYAFYSHAAPNFSDEVLIKNRKIADKDQQAIRDLMQAYCDTPTASLHEPELPSLSLGAPILTFETTTKGPWGNTKDGVPFTDIPSIAEALGKKTQMIRIDLRAGDWINKVTTTYSQPLADNKKEHSHGDDLGGDRGSLTFDSQAFIMHISGSFTKVRLRELRIIGSNGSLDGGLPDTHQEEFNVSFNPNDGVIPLGFCGVAVANGEVNALGLVCAKLLAATWEPYPPL